MQDGNNGNNDSWKNDVKSPLLFFSIRLLIRIFHKFEIKIKLLFFLMKCYSFFNRNVVTK